MINSTSATDTTPTHFATMYQVLCEQNTSLDNLVGDLESKTNKVALNSGLCLEKLSPKENSDDTFVSNMASQLNRMKALIERLSGVLSHVNQII